MHVRDNLELKPSAYRITLRGVMVGEGEAFPGMFLAINPGGISTPLIGTQTTDPAFGLPAHWIDERQKEAAQMAGFTVVDSETVMATHLSHLMQVHAAKLISRTETQQLVEHVAKLAPKLIEEVIPKMVSITTFQKVLQLLLEDSVHVRDIRTIIETLAEHSSTTQDPVELARRVRIALSPSIVQQIYGPTRELNVIAIEPDSSACWCRPCPTPAPLTGSRRGRDPHPEGGRHGQPARRAGPACLPAGPRFHPQLHCPPGAPRGAASAGSRPQRDPRDAHHPHRLDS